MTTWRLNQRDRQALAELIRCTSDGHVLRRAYALQRVARGDPISDIAADLGVTRQSVYNWIARFDDYDGSDLGACLVDAARSGRPKHVSGVIDPLIEAIIDADPRDLGYAATTWTAPLLVRYLSERHAQGVSLQSVRLAIERLDIRWKRPRHSLALRPVHWRQAKGG